MNTSAFQMVKDHISTNDLRNNPMELYQDPQWKLFDQANDLKTEIADLLAVKVIDNLLAEKLGSPAVWALDDREVKILDLLQQVTDLISDIEVTRPCNTQEYQTINVKLKGVRYVD